jgi:hypothetical protein
LKSYIYSILRKETIGNSTIKKECQQPDRKCMQINYRRRAYRVIHGLVSYAVKADSGCFVPDLYFLKLKIIDRKQFFLEKSGFFFAGLQNVCIFAVLKI